MKKHYEAVPVEDGNLPTGEVFAISINGEKLLGVLFQKDGYVYCRSLKSIVAVTHFLREVGSSVSTEDIIEMIDEETERIKKLWGEQQAPTVAWTRDTMLLTLENLRSRITGKM